MRPLRLEFCAFGSYPDTQVVDFQLLARRGTFLVTGPTGSGKSTVFDAMVYALYGDLPGQRRGQGEPRSHHADPAAETYVELDFEVDGERYRVRRSPAQQRPARRGGGMVDQTVSATLVRLLPGGGTESLATRANAAATVCAELVGLSSEQFQRVVLLPQGRFADFLIAPERDREQLLSQLFGGGLYTSAVQWMKDTLKELDDKVAGDDQQIDHHRANAVAALRFARGAWLGLDDPSVDLAGVPLDALGISELRTMVAEVLDRRSAHEVEVREAEQVAAELHARQRSIHAEAQRFDDAAGHRAALHMLEAERAEVLAGVAAADASAAARPVVAGAAALDGATQQAARAEAALVALRAAVEHGFGALGVPMPEFHAAGVAAELARVEATLQQRRRTIEAAAAATDAAAKAEAQRDALDAALGEASRVVAELVDRIAAASARRAELSAAAAPLSDLRHRCASAEADHARRGRLDAAELAVATLQAAADTERQRYIDLHARWIAAGASRLAAELVAGSPCPVCGSAEHPSPATHDGGDPVESSALKSALDAHIAADAAVAGAVATVQQLHTELGVVAERSTDELAAVVAALRAEQAAAAAAADELVAVEAQVVELDQHHATAVEAHHRAVVDRESVASTAAGLRAEATRLDHAMIEHGIVPTEVSAHMAVLDSLQHATADMATVFDAVQQAAATLSERQRQLTEALAIAALPDLAAAHSLVLSPEVEAGHRERQQRWSDALVAHAAALDLLQRQGIPDQRPDTDTVAAAAAEAGAVATEQREAFVTVSNAAIAAGEQLDAAERVIGDSADVRRERDTARRVFDMCSGRGKAGRLERWVLGRELGRVVAAASVHLARMTGHRYRLDRAEGLVLEVFDAHTGRSRATASLSGGEQFQASLALALGLADVVSHGGSASGKTFEALFVDEGFGSLDPDSLDLAIEALGMLQAGGRMVGAITHVEAMKQRLNPGIEVRRRADGKGSSLQVVPL